MNGTPAGWYDDPEQPGQQRYWDGNAWTEHRAPGAGGAPTPPPAAAPAPAPAAPPAAPAPPPPMAPPAAAAAAAGATAAMAPPPVAAPAKSSHKGLWIALTVIGLFFVLIIVAIAAVALLGKNTDATAKVEENLRTGLQNDLASQGLDVTVSALECQDVKQENGPFTTSCTMTVAGLTPTVPVDVTGTIDGDSISANGKTTVNILNDALAVKATQQIVAAVAPTVTVLTCTLAQPLVLVEEGLTFTCDTDSSETATFQLQGGQLVLTDVQ
jgi:hypothetical protein